MKAEATLGSWPHLSWLGMRGGAGQGRAGVGRGGPVPPVTGRLGREGHTRHCQTASFPLAPPCVHTVFLIQRKRERKRKDRKGLKTFAGLIFWPVAPPGRVTSVACHSPGRGQPSLMSGMESGDRNGEWRRVVPKNWVWPPEEDTRDARTQATRRHGLCTSEGLQNAHRHMDLKHGFILLQRNLRPLHSFL